MECYVKQALHTDDESLLGILLTLGNPHDDIKDVIKVFLTQVWVKDNRTATTQMNWSAARDVFLLATGVECTQDEFRTACDDLRARVAAK